jgi:hypothetical protein
VCVIYCTCPCIIHTFTYVLHTHTTNTTTSGEDFSRLFEDVKSYKQFTKQRFTRLAPKAHWSMAATPIKGRYVTEDQTFEDVIRKMRDGNIHRVWVCSAASVREGRPVPIKVLSQGDVLKQVLKNYSIPPSGTDMDVM